ncbi:hypothetical protein DFH06DRAFT_1445927, partial [Mycena polygramma]
PKATNFLSLNRDNESIKGTYAIDPSVKVPEFLLPPLAAGETEATRPNVYLHTTNGSIDVNVFLVGCGDAKRRVDIVLESSNGSISVKLHDAHAHTRPPINLKARSVSGNITLHIPHSFRGPLTFTSHNGALRFPGALAGHVTTFGDADHMQRCFVGDFADWAQQPEGWMCDEIDVKTENGAVKVQYDGAEMGTGTAGLVGKKHTFLGKLFAL